MKKITKVIFGQRLAISKKLIQIALTSTPIEIGCVIASYFMYLFTEQTEWLYYGLPMLGIIHCTNGTKYYHTSPILYAGYLALAYHAGFPNTLICISSLTALTCLCLYGKVPMSVRIYQLTRNFFISIYYSTLILLSLIFLYVAISMTGNSPEKLKEILAYSCMFIFSAITPILWLAIDKYRKKESPSIPKVVKWTHLIVTETAIIIGTVYLGYSIFLMSFNSLKPRPYVVYIVISFLLAIEICAKLHEWAPRNWNSLFFQKRNFIYIPIILLGVTSLCIEYTLVGFIPRTLAASLLLLWISIVSISRLIGIHYITKNERKASIGVSITILISIIMF